MTQRKGLGDLLAAMRSLNRNDVELIVMGSLQAPMEFYRQEFANFTYEPGRAHAQVLELMRSCDVFCLPSIVEGRALVMQEAMSQGLPLIITPNTGGEDLIAEGITGFLVPIRRPELIAEKIAWFADHRAMLPEMSRAAQAKAAQLTWDIYGQTIVRAIRENLEGGK
jgi:glycosyltransferase involved in cell wall biosynthesis